MIHQGIPYTLMYEEYLKKFFETDVLNELYKMKA